MRWSSPGSAGSFTCTLPNEIWSGGPSAARCGWQAPLEPERPSWLSIVLGQSSGAADLFRSEPWDNAWGFLQELLGIPEAEVNELIMEGVVTA